MMTLIMITTLANNIARVSVCTSIVKALHVRFCSGTNVNIVLIVTSALNKITDLYMLGIPVTRVIKMHVKTNKKIGLLIIFLGGLV